MTPDLVSALESFGYTEREAAFLYLVAAHSGYFLRRQFNFFIDRQKGFLAHRFLEKARTAGHVETIDYGQGFHLYHLFSKPIYRLLGNPDSQNRRRKGDGAIRARLMTLDYVLENNAEHYLVGEVERRHFFTEARRIRPEHLPKGFTLSAVPLISVADRTHSATSLARFVFVDEGLISTRRFTRFVTEMAPLFRALGVFELIYAAGSDYNFPAAEHEFRRYFEPLVPVRQRALLPCFEQEQPHRRVPLDARFATLLFHTSYPPIQRSERRESVPGSEAGSGKTSINTGAREDAQHPGSTTG